MLRLISGLISLGIIIAVGTGILYFLPTEIKTKTLDTISSLSPDFIREKIEGLILTPSEERDKLINELEEKLEEIKNSESVESAKEAIEKSKNALIELKEKNDELSLTEIIKTKFVERILEKQDIVPECDCSQAEN